MRNAILLADVQANGGDRGLIWSVFASRGMGYAASTVDTDDVHPLPGLHHPARRVHPRGQPGRRGARPGHGRAARGSARGLLGPRQRAGRGSRYAHRRQRQLSHRRSARAHLGARDHCAGAGYDRAVVANVAIAAGTTSTRNFALRRNWALESGGAGVQSFTGPDFASFGCGPRSAIDGSSRSVWSTRPPTYPSLPGAKEIVIQLPQPITLGEVRIDPSTGCGDPAAAAVAGYQVQVSANASTYTTVGQGTFRRRPRGGRTRWRSAHGRPASAT